MVYTVRFATGRGGRTGFEAELARLGIAQKNSRPNHPTTCGKVERFQQTLKRWLDPQPAPNTLAELQTLCDTFRPHLQPAAAAPIATAPRDPRHDLHRATQSHPRRPRPTPTTASDTTASTTPAPSPCASTADSTTSASDEPTPEPTSSSSSTTSTSASSTPPPANSSATHHRPHPRLPTHRPTQRTHPPQQQTARTQLRVRAVLDVSRHHTVRAEGVEPSRPKTPGPKPGASAIPPRSRRGER